MIVSAALTGPTYAKSQFVAEKTWNHGLWSAHLFRNLSANQLFCAVEARNGGTDFRINKYKHSNETFLEIYNPSWQWIEGNTRISISFTTPEGAYSVDFAAKSWGDSFTHDFLEQRNYDIVLGLLVSSRSLNVLNANGTSIAQFGGDGSKQAVQSFVLCNGS